jgi:nitrogen fixation-related uncharacterized protein
VVSFFIFAIVLPLIIWGFFVGWREKQFDKNNDKEEIMLVFDISDFTQNTIKVFDAALTNEVIIYNKNGKSYKILPINDEKTGKLPLEDVPYI